MHLSILWCGQISGRIEFEFCKASSRASSMWVRLDTVDKDLLKTPIGVSVEQLTHLFAEEFGKLATANVHFGPATHSITDTNHALALTDDVSVFAALISFIELRAVFDPSVEVWIDQLLSLCLRHLWSFLLEELPHSCCSCQYGHWAVRLVYLIEFAEHLLIQSVWCYNTGFK